MRYIHLEILGSGGSRREQRAQRNERASLAGQRENSELSIEERVQVLPSSDQWESLSSSALVTGEGVVDASAVTSKLSAQLLKSICGIFNTVHFMFL